MLHEAPVHRYRFGGFEFDAADGSLSQVDGGRGDRLRPAAATVLLTLLLEAGEVVDRERMREAIWGSDRVVDFEAGLAALLRELRKTIENLGGDAAIIETIPKRGYRLLATVQALPVAVSASDPGRAGPTSVRARARLRSLFFGVATMAMLIWLWIAVGSNSSPETVALPDEVMSMTLPSLAILPIRVYGESPLLPEHVSILLADTLLAELWRAGLEDLTLLGRIAIQPYLERDDLAAAVAEDLGLSLLLQGSLRASESGWWLELQLLEVPPGRVLWSHRVEGAAEPLRVNELAAALTAEISQRWPEIRTRLEPD